MEELKVRIDDRAELEKRLEELNAEFLKTEKVRDTYFSGQGKDALKIAETEEGSFLRRYESKKPGFELVKDQELENPEEKRNNLSERLGVKADQRKVQDFYSIDGKTVILNSIEGLGDFLIVQGEGVDKEFIKDKLGVENPEYIEVPFSDLD